MMSKGIPCLNNFFHRVLSFPVQDSSETHLQMFFQKSNLNKIFSILISIPFTHLKVQDFSYFVNTKKIQSEIQRVSCQYKPLKRIKKYLYLILKLSVLEFKQAPSKASIEPS